MNNPSRWDFRTVGPVLSLLVGVLFSLHACGSNSNPTTPKSISPTSTATPVITNTATNSPTKTPTTSVTATTTNSSTATPTNSPTLTPTSSVTATTTNSSTATPTNSPTLTPTQSPTNSPTNSPTSTPTSTPTNSPVPHIFITSFGGYDSGTYTGNGKLHGPDGVDVDKANGRLYVSDSGGYSLQRFDLSGNFQANLFLLSSPYIIKPEGLAVDGSGTLYVADSQNHSVDVMNSSGVTSAIWSTWGGGGLGYFGGPRDATLVAGASTTVIVADFDGNRIDFFQTNGTFIRDITVGGPVGVAVDSSGNLWATDSSDLYRFAPGASSANLTVTSLNGTALDNVNGLCVDSNDNVYLADSNNGRVVEVNNSGSYLFTFGGFSQPADVTTDSSGNVYILDRGDQTVYKYGP